MQTAELVAGRELDALVAEKVMGWQCAAKGDLYHYWGTEPGWHNGRQWDRLPAFSTDIAAAWKVVERMLPNGHFDIECYGTEEFVALHDGEWQGYGNTAPLAICRAALAAVDHS